MLITTLLFAAAVIAVVLLVAAFRQPGFRVARSITIAALPNAIFAQVNDLRLWQGWSPWEKVDPALKRTYSGEPSGRGSIYAWEGNRNVGSGRMTILETREFARIEIKLEFFKPMAGLCRAEFTFEPQGGATTVTWSMTGNSNFIARIFSLFICTDKMIGTQFEKGLSQLKAIAENSIRAQQVA